MAPTLTDIQQIIREECDTIRDFLIEKNASYGNSVFDPIRIFSDGDPVQQIHVRIDDKLSRIMRGREYGTEDTELDLIGYLILKRALVKALELGTEGETP
jgi:hypothetical protein